MNRIIECVPNFSEGRDQQAIDAIVSAIQSVDGVLLLHVDSGKGANRTVVTFAGVPEDVVEAAFRGVKKAAEVIDMSVHQGEHPRFGATDVLPLIPIAGVTMDEVVEYARRLGQRMGDELGISVYSYAEAAFDVRRCDLAYCRAGQYEGLPAKLATTDGKPDFGPDKLNVRSGASAVGARDFLIAYNVNLDTASVDLANEIAADVRESGRKAKNEAGQILRVRGSLKSVKAIGWYIPEFRFAQVSMNLTSIRVTPLHLAYEEVVRKAQERGVAVSGSEIVGLVPLQSLVEAGRYFFQKKGAPSDASEHELVRKAIQAMGLSQIYEFKPEEKIIEYVMLRK